MAYECPTTSNRSKFKYEFSWVLWMNNLLPIIRRQLKIFSWFAVPYKELNNRYLRFLDFRCQWLFQSASNGQTIKLERYLNLLFDKEDKRIYIENVTSNFETLFVYGRTEDPSAGDESYIYNKGETIPVDGNQEYIFRKSEVQLSKDFIVRVPTEIYTIINLEYLGVVVEEYKFAGTTFKIEKY